VGGGEKKEQEKAHQPKKKTNETKGKGLTVRGDGGKKKKKKGEKHGGTEEGALVAGRGRLPFTCSEKRNHLGLHRAGSRKWTVDPWQAASGNTEKFSRRRQRTLTR